MWKCPVCGREFKNTNQSHYCSSKPKTIDEYIFLQPLEHQADLNALRNMLRETIPDAEERISWSMPTYWKGKNIIHFAAFAKHIGLYPGEEAVSAFANELCDYDTAKGTIRIPYGKVDCELIGRIAQWCLLNNGNN